MTATPPLLGGRNEILDALFAFLIWMVGAGLIAASVTLINRPSLS